jgi:hypothetical protein
MTQPPDPTSDARALGSVLAGVQHQSGPVSGRGTGAVDRLLVLPLEGYFITSCEDAERVFTDSATFSSRAPRAVAMPERLAARLPERVTNSTHVTARRATVLALPARTCQTCASGLRTCFDRVRGTGRRRSTHFSTACIASHQMNVRRPQPKVKLFDMDGNAEVIP